MCYGAKSVTVVIYVVEVGPQSEKNGKWKIKGKTVDFEFSEFW